MCNRYRNILLYQCVLHITIYYQPCLADLTYVVGYSSILFVSKEINLFCKLQKILYEFFSFLFYSSLKVKNVANLVHGYDWFL